MLGSIQRKPEDMIVPVGDKGHALCGARQTWASKARGTLQTLDVAPSIRAGPRPGGTPLPFSSLLPVWDEA